MCCMWNSVFLIFLGGGLGSVLRFVIGQYVSGKMESSIPLGTLVVNILGSFLLGALVGFIHKMNLASSQYVLFFTIGFCGGFTTFSTFAYENHVFLKSGDFMSFALYTIASFIVGFLAVFAGIYLIK